MGVVFVAVYCSQGSRCRGPRNSAVASPLPLPSTAPPPFAARSWCSCCSCCSCRRRSRGLGCFSGHGLSTRCAAGQGSKLPLPGSRRRQLLCCSHGLRLFNWDDPLPPALCPGLARLQEALRPFLADAAAAVDGAGGSAPLVATFQSFWGSLPWRHVSLPFLGCFFPGTCVDVGESAVFAQCNALYWR